MEAVFKALASVTRRKILAYLSNADLTAGEIADRFDMSKPAISNHLNTLRNAGLVKEEKKGQYVIYSIQEDRLVNSVMGYLSEICPVSAPLKRESRELQSRKKSDNLKT